MGNSLCNDFNLSMESRSALTLQDAKKRSTELMKEEEKYLNARSSLKMRHFAARPTTPQQIGAARGFSRVPSYNSTHTMTTHPMQMAGDTNNNDNSDQIAAYHAAADSNNPSLAYSEYASDSSEAHSSDETTYTAFVNMFNQRNVISGQLVKATEASLLTTNFDCDAALPLAHQNNEQLNKELPHSIVVDILSENAGNAAHHEVAQKSDEKQRVAIEQKQCKVEIDSPVLSNEVSVQIVHSPPLPSTPPPSQTERSAQLSFVNHAPRQSVTDEINFEIVAQAESSDVDTAAPQDCKRNRSANPFWTGGKSRAYSSSPWATRDKTTKSKNWAQSECGSVEHCISVKRLTKAMKWYQKHANDKDKLYAKMERKGYVEYVLGDYQHVLDVHLNDSCTDVVTQYAKIRERVHAKIKQTCAVHSCVGLNRLLNDEYQAADLHDGGKVSIHSKKDKLEFYIHSMDLIHAYLLHLECLY